MSYLSTDTFSVANDLLQFGEDATAEWVLACTEEEFLRVCAAAAFLSSYGPTTPSGAGMMLAKACAIGAVYVHDGKPRRLARGRRDTRRPLPPRPEWARKHTNHGLQWYFDEFYGISDDFVAFWAEAPDEARDLIARERTSWQARPRSMPSVPTHVRETDGGRYRFELNDWARPFADQWGHMLGDMDGAENAIFSTWALPPGQRLGDFDPDAYDTGYMQSAGAADRMTVEVRYREDDGAWRQYAVGRPGGSFAGEPTESIKYGDQSVQVFGDEVFTALEAAPIYEAYRVTGRVPAEYHLRQLDL